MKIKVDVYTANSQWASVFQSMSIVPDAYANIMFHELLVWRSNGSSKSSRIDDSAIDYPGYKENAQWLSGVLAERGQPSGHDISRTGGLSPFR